MADEAIVNEDTQTSTDDSTVVAEEIPTVDDYNRLKQEKEELEKKNKQLYARVKQTEPLKKSDTPDLSEMEKRLEKKLELKSQGYTEEDVAFINSNGGDVNNPYVKAALDAQRQQREVEKAADINSTGQSDIEKKYSNAELRAMTPDELAKVLPHA